jgi:hypothetical protein
MTAARRFRAQLPLFALVTMVTGGVALFMIPRLGLNGAALSIGGGAVVQILGSGLIICRAVKHKTARRIPA